MRVGCFLLSTKLTAHSVGTKQIAQKTEGVEKLGGSAFCYVEAEAEAEEAEGGEATILDLQPGQLLLCLTQPVAQSG